MPTTNWVDYRGESIHWHISHIIIPWVLKSGMFPALLLVHRNSVTKANVTQRQCL